MNAIHRTKPTVQLHDADGSYPFLIEFSIEKVLSDQQGQKENVLRLQKVIQQLSAKQKEIIHLKFYEQLDNGQISGLMSISHQSVYNLLHEGIKKIRQIWWKEFGTKITYMACWHFLWIVTKG